MVALLFVLAPSAGRRNERGSHWRISGWRRPSGTSPTRSVGAAALPQADAGLGQAALAWAAAIKEVTYFLDPSLEVRVEVASGTPGSFELNAWLRKLGVTKENEKLTLKAVAFIVVAWFSVHTLDYGFERLADFVTGADNTEESFSPQQRISKAASGKSLSETCFTLTGSLSPQPSPIYSRLSPMTTSRAITTIRTTAPVM